MGIYALYKGEQMLSTGTIYEIAKELNVEVKTIKYYGTNAYKRKLEKRNVRNARELVKLDKMISCGNCPYLDDCEENDECPFWEDDDD